ncbi:putative 2-oxoglutarate-dependent dioxygenase ANS, partial [Bienertia sinuspersici]
MAIPFESPMKLELPSKSVQELLETTAKQVPDRYICQLPRNSSADNQAETKYMDSPVIDLSLLSASSSQQREEELQKLRSVLSSWGCLQLVNHGLSSSLLDQIREVGKEFFALPLEMKQKHSRTLDWFEGYGADTVSQGQNYNWNDRLHLIVHPLERRNFKFWPEYIPNFRETLEEYTMEQKRVLEKILEAIAKSLNLEENSLFSACGGQECISMFTRFNYYPPCSSPDQVLGLKPHSDGTTITILLQDKQVEGLQVQKDNQWFKVPIVPNAVFINVGDQLEIMSNGILKSAVHKVVIDKEKERTSVVTVCIPHPDKEIGPFSELIDEERPHYLHILESPSKMAVSTESPMKLELPSKSVQELIKTTSKQVPERYIYHSPNESSTDNNQAEIKYMDSPTVDLSLLSDSSSQQHNEELQKLQYVLSSWGCLQLINHGLSSSLLDKIREVGKEFFALPLEMKQKHSRTFDWFEGYGGDTTSENHSYNWNDRLHLRVQPLEQRNFKFWPEYIPNFRPHSDGTAITILLQDKQVEGLQVQKDNQWFKVPVVPDALFINVGDQLEIMSNGILKSAVHKVVIDKERERMSVVVLVRELVEDLFVLPQAVKQKHSRTLEWIEGYGNDSVSEIQNYNWNDRLDLMVYPIGLRSFKFWPEDLPRFSARNAPESHCNFAQLEENSFLRECEGEHRIYTIARSNYYPPCSTPDQVIGLKPHSDASAVTILLQDKEVEGLQVQKDDQWFNVPIVPDALSLMWETNNEQWPTEECSAQVVIDKVRERKSVAM